MAIQYLKVSTAYAGRDISSLSDRPNEDGISTPNLKLRFDQIGKEIIPNFNALIDLLDAYIQSNDSDIIALGNAIEALGISLGSLQISVQEVLDAYAGGLFNGKSAYQLAVIAGFVGTEAQWLASLKGEQGLGLLIKGQYATLLDLQTAHPVGSLGDAWAVGTVENSDLYIWDTLTTAWKDIGQVGINMNAESVLVVDIGGYWVSTQVEAILQEIGLNFNPSSSKTTPVDADTIIIADSEASGLFKKLTWANIKATLKTYFDGLYAIVNHTHTTYSIKPTNEATATANQILEANGDGTSTYVDFSGGGQLLGTATIKAISYNAQVINENITIPSTYNAMSVGDITIGNGFTVTLETGAVWKVV